MRVPDINDAILVEESVEFLDMLASYREGCRVLEEAEAGLAAEQDVEEMQQRIIISGRQWRAALLRIGTAVAYTDTGMLAKCNAIQGYLAEYPAEDIGVEALLNSLVEDIARRAAPRWDSGWRCGNDAGGDDC